MALFLNDTFTDTSGVVLDDHNGETGADWTRHGSSPATVRAIISDANRARADLNGGTSGARPIYYASGTPGSADYEVTVNVRIVTAIRELHFGARFSTGAETGYYVRIRPSNSDLTLQTATAGTIANVSLVAHTWSAATSYVVKLTMTGTTLKVYVDDVEKISVTDATFSTAGVVVVAPDCFGNITNTAGPHIDSITAGTAGQTIAVGQASTTNTAQAITARKTLAVGQASEANSAQPVTARKTVTAGTATETSTAQAATVRKTLGVGAASETDTAQAVTALKTLAVAQASETDAAQALAARKTAALAQAVETNTAQAASVRKTLTVGQATETDAAQVVAAVLASGRTIAVGQASSVEAARSIQPVSYETPGSSTYSGAAGATYSGDSTATYRGE